MRDVMFCCPMMPWRQSDVEDLDEHSCTGLISPALTIASEGLQYQSLTLSEHVAERSGLLMLL